MPTIKREDWLKLSPREKLMHEIERKIDQLNQLQERYDRGRASGEISEPIPFWISGRSLRRRIRFFRDASAEWFHAASN